MLTHRISLNPPGMNGFTVDPLDFNPDSDRNRERMEQYHDINYVFDSVQFYYDKELRILYQEELLLYILRCINY